MSYSCEVGGARWRWHACISKMDFHKFLKSESLQRIVLDYYIIHLNAHPQPSGLDLQAVFRGRGRGLMKSGHMAKLFFNEGPILKSYQLTEVGPEVSNKFHTIGKDILFKQAIPIGLAVHNVENSTWLRPVVQTTKGFSTPSKRGESYK